MGSVVYAGGDFTSMGGQTRRGLAAVDATTGTVTGWIGDMPDPSYSYPHQVVPTPSGIGVGGTFRLIGRARGNIAAVDLNTRDLLDWNPGASSEVLDILPSGGTVYIAGKFTFMGGSLRPILAAVDASSGAVQSWTVPIDGSYAKTLVVHDGAMHVGGGFSTTSGPYRLDAAAFDLVTGAATAWAPNADEPVFELLFDNDRWYHGGVFTSIGGSTRQHVAVIDDGAGDAIPGWNPGTSGQVEALALDAGTLYLGGAFVTTAGVSRNNVAAVQAANGTLTSWNPDASGTVRTLLVADGSIYLGGDFTTVGGANRVSLARVDPTTGVADGWTPVPAAAAYGATRVFDLARQEPLLFVAGEFVGVRVQGEERDNLAVVSTDAATGVPDPAFLSNRLLLPVAPNPIRDEARLRFVLPRADRVSLAVFDVSGREVARPIQDQRLEAGIHEASLATRGLKPGVYLVRLTAGAIIETGRFVVVK